MDSIATRLDHFPPEVVAPGTPFSNLSLDHIHAGIASHETAISYLENLIFHHKRAIARYRGSLNEAIPCINKMLPVEIITEIFLTCRALCSQPQPNQKYRPYAWLKVTHVCRYWRNIALATPLLFSVIEIPMKSPRTKEFFRVSKLAPLDVRLHLGSRSSWEELVLLLPRTRTLTIDRVEGPVLDDWIWPESRVLSSFEYACTNSRHNGRSWFDRDLRDIMPNLKYLNACCIYFGPSWPSHSLPRTLHTLILKAWYDGESGDVNMILQKLIELPQLKNLNISNLSLDRQDYVPPSDQTECYLGHLDCLKISGDIYAILTLLSRTRSVDRIVLNPYPEGVDETISLLLPRVLQTKLAPVHPDSLAIFNNSGLTCEFTRNEYRGFRLRLFVGPDPDDYAFPLALYHVEFGIEHNSSTLSESLIGALASHLSLVTKCRIEAFDDSLKVAPIILHEMPSVTDLHISQLDYKLGPLFPAVFAWNDEHGLILPRLREMQIELYPLNGSIARPLMTFCVRLRDALHSRKEHKAELRALKLVFGHGDAWDDLNALGILDQMKSSLDPTIGRLDMVPPQTEV